MTREPFPAPAVAERPSSRAAGGPAAGGRGSGRSVESFFLVSTVGLRPRPRRPHRARSRRGDQGGEQRVRATGRSGPVTVVSENVIESAPRGGRLNSSRRASAWRRAGHSRPRAWPPRRPSGAPPDSRGQVVRDHPSLPVLIGPSVQERVGQRPNPSHRADGRGNRVGTSRGAGQL